ncbi:EAL domain-containing protein [Pelagibacterium sp. 26DY04]|uniref:putative bifunctional diguanylate cyclase/phosphodiesterase n=1 Tax=Pelagibacterium sp. 26DY04 TaxID=2967130 RepID=UPI0028166ACF|nr:EAL domain-containing protein [Pelagibacterium sp. 26DY04]WMT87441.1 EAL domain-containing protein [Pelagibacterium sp. 26DY04]
MTGLANRSSFNDRLDAEIARATLARTKLAVLCLDLDRFKEVNDLFGHGAGDALLQKVASIIEASLVGNQFAARLGGDEFALILPDLDSASQAATATRALLDAFEQANVAGEGGLISASVGIAIFPNDARVAEQLMTFADTALYCAKGEGRGTYRLFEAEMGAQVRDRRKLEHDLRQAMAGDQLSLVYQPQVDIGSGDVTGFEALLRWSHPQRGEIPPSEFIPIAEESGLVLQLGEWVMRSACQEAASWSNPLMIAVNVSPVQLHSPNFVGLVEQVLGETGLSPSRLEIEITETAMIRNMNRALSAMRKIKALGVRIAMDDFGTGYSSLSNLRAFPFDRIKVDQSFIRSVHTNDQAAAIVRAVVGLGKGLNLPIMAEGVEQAEELDFLRTEICDSAQGYWFGRPQAIAAYHDIVRGRHTRIEPAPAANGARKLAS